MMKETVIYLAETNQDRFLNESLEISKEDEYDIINFCIRHLSYHLFPVFNKPQMYTEGITDPFKTKSYPLNEVSKLAKKRKQLFVFLLLIEHHNQSNQSCCLSLLVLITDESISLS